MVSNLFGDKIDRHCRSRAIMGVFLIECPEWTNRSFWSMEMSMPEGDSIGELRLRKRQEYNYFYDYFSFRPTLVREELYAPLKFLFSKMQIYECYH